MRRLWFYCALTGLFALVPLARGDNISGGFFASGGTNKDPRTRAAIAAGIRFDAYLLPLPVRPRTDTFDIGIGYDRVQGRGGLTLDGRARIPIFRCYGWESNCVGNKRFWLEAVPSLGKRWGRGGLGAYAGMGVQGVLDLNPGYGCCRLAVGIRHRFPINGTLHGDNALVVELRSYIAWVDRGPPPPPGFHRSALSKLKALFFRHPTEQQVRSVEWRAVDPARDGAGSGQHRTQDQASMLGH